MLFQRDNREGWNSAQAGYLEGRLTSALKNLPEINIRSDRSDIDRSLSKGRQETLDEFIPSIIAILSLAGLPAAAKQEAKAPKKPRRKTPRSYKVSILELVESGYITAGSVVTYIRKERAISGKITEDGRIFLEGKFFESPSSAGKFIYGGAINGWDYLYLGPGKTNSLADVRERYLKNQEQ